MHSIKKIQFENFVWTHINHPDHETVEYLEKNFKFHPITLTDVLSASQRTRIDTHDEYSYSVFTFPHYNRNSRDVQSVKLNIFIGKKFLITIIHGDLKILKNIVEVYATNSILKNNYKKDGSEKLLFEILNRLYLETMPMIDHLILDCDKTEDRMFSGKEKKMISEILVIRKNIIDFRKTLQGHKDILKKLIHSLAAKHYYNSLIDHTKEIWNNLDNLKERIEALQQTNESQISFKLSDIMKLLTVISVITFPVTLIASIFGMNTIRSMPFIDTPYDFWAVMGLIFITVITMILFFRKKKWL